MNCVSVSVVTPPIIRDAIVEVKTISDFLFQRLNQNKSHCTLTKSFGSLKMHADVRVVFGLGGFSHFFHHALLMTSVKKQLILSVQSFAVSAFCPVWMNGIGSEAEGACCFC